ncbi:VanW family protein [Anaerobacillus sp. MEB173]|uniref:VanW family protein n=1 Tax=Anaerobacillus sp. MEB173 TaxID=3383345 RepID=UPI003F9390D8
MRYQLLTLFILIFQITINTDQLIVTEQGKTIASVSREEFTLPYLSEPMINNEKYNEFVDTLDHQVYEKPVNAFIDKNNHIVDEQVGYKLNREAFTEVFFHSFFKNGSATIEVPKLILYPKVDREILANIRTQKIGEYVTYFNSRNKMRANNILLAVEAINNQVVFPGETFSFNKVLGNRTKEKGYLPAPVIIKGKVYQGVGGGICQVSSTLFNAVDKAGVEILERYSHSKRVPYVPPGRDATVSWYGPDFIFRNSHNQPILIRAFMYHGMVIVTVHSSDVINYDPRKVPNVIEPLPK